MKRAIFLTSAAALAAAAFLRESTLAAAGTADEREFETLLATVLPFGDPNFPLRDRTKFAQRVEDLFHLRESSAFQASLWQFGSLPAFTAPSPELSVLERALVEGAQPDNLLERDARAFAAAGLPKRGIFADLNREQRAAYLQLWAQSAFCARRRFYTSVRAIAFESFYSTPAAWNAIGYAGPVLRGGRRS